MAMMETLLGIGIGLLVLLVILLIAGFVFWLWMFIDVLKKRDTMWIVLFVVSALTGFLSGLLATIYYFVEYRKK